jgi:hypothetical protein
MLNTAAEIMRGMARRLRSSQVGEEWNAIRDSVVTLIDLVINANGATRRYSRNANAAERCYAIPLDSRAALVQSILPSILLSPRRYGSQAPVAVGADQCGQQSC